MIVSILVLAAVGFALSLYDFIIERKIKSTPDYKPVCDLSDRISCSKPIKSEYANLLFISNALVGMLYYGIVGVLSYINAEIPLLIVVAGGFLFSIFLAYILFFKVKSFCLVCVSLYVVNTFMLIVLLSRFLKG